MLSAALLLGKAGLDWGVTPFTQGRGRAANSCVAVGYAASVPQRLVSLPQIRGLSFTPHRTTLYLLLEKKIKMLPQGWPVSRVHTQRTKLKLRSFAGTDESARLS